MDTPVAGATLQRGWHEPVKAVTVTHNNQNPDCFKKSEAEPAIAREAIVNVMGRKCSELAELQKRYEAGCCVKGGPPKGLGAKIESLRREIVNLEAALEVLHE